MITRTSRLHDPLANRRDVRRHGAARKREEGVGFVKVYADYEARCRAHGGWSRPRDDLWELLQDGDISPLRLLRPAYAAAFWTLAFGDRIEGAWADGSLDWPTETQWARFHEATRAESDEASA